MTTEFESRKVKFTAFCCNEKREYIPESDRYVGLENIESWSGRIVGNVDTKPQGLVNVFKPNDILFGKLRPYLAKVALPDFRGVCSTEALVLRHYRNAEPRYLQYSFLRPEFVDEIDASTYGAKMPRASWEFISSRRVPLPPPEAQRAIADFLDRETARIDQLIQKKQRLVELLEERLENSLGKTIREVGETNSFWKLRYICRIKRGRFNHRPRNAPELYGGEHPFLQTGDIAQAKKYVTANKQALSDLGSQVSASFPCGTVLMAIAANVGDTAITTFRAYCPDSVVGFIPTKRITSEYLYICLRSLRSEISKGSTSNAQDNTNIARLGALSIPVPDINRQLSIVSTLDRAEQSFLQISFSVNESIDRLREFRSALITAAVTGQIDVNEWSQRGRTDAKLDAIAEEMEA